MSRRVVVHIGLPKTGTSFLQAIIWSQRARLRELGVLVPGREKRDHLLSSMIVREDPGVRRRGPGAAEAWDVVRGQVAEHDGVALISHEFFCSATAEQAARMVADLRHDGRTEVHVVITAREPLGLFTSSWQESLKNKGTTPIADYGRGESDDPRDVWDWRALDLGLVLERWGGVVPPERLHVITPPPSGAPRTELWRRYAGVLGIDPESVEVDEGFPNASMGVVEAELLRRLNGRLTGFDSAYDRGRWLRSFLADDRLVPRNGERFWPLPHQIADARARGARAHAALLAGGYDVVGDPDSLLVPDELEERRTPASVTDAEVAEVAVELIATLLDDVRQRSGTRKPPRRPPPESDKPRTSSQGLFSRLRRP